jgi:hypothetical protein
VSGSYIPVPESLDWYIITEKRQRHSSLIENVLLETGAAKEFRVILVK